jgi:flagellar basal body-associated protein FliL
MGRSGLIMLIVVVLLAIGGYFVLHRRAATEPTPPEPEATPQAAPSPAAP